MRWFANATLVALTASSALHASDARAALIHVGTADDFDKIESAGPGDEVVIAPGTYRFRVYLEAKAAADAPLLIHAEDPQNPPVWDLSAGNVEDAPGSYTAGDRGRGCWQLSGATNVHISDIVITNCHNAAHNSAGIRYYSGARGIELSNVTFRGNDNGLTGGTEDSEISVAFSEFDANGTLLAPDSAPSHNIYIYGGRFTLRYSYVHDPVQGQNFHIRATDALLEYNWFARAKSYQGDLMTSDDYDGSGGLTQTLTLRGNVLVQGDTQSNTSQIIAVYNDAEASGLTLETRLLYNTFVGNGGHAALVHLSNADGTDMSARLEDNLIAGTNTATLFEDAAHASVSGSHNWLETDADDAGLEDSVFDDDPRFVDATNADFRLQAGSSAIGAASAPSDAPDREYFRDEMTTRQYRARASADDIGAFESSTMGSGISAHDAPTDGGAPGDGGQPNDTAGDGGATENGGRATSGGSSGRASGGSTGHASGGGEQTPTSGGTTGHASGGAEQSTSGGASAPGGAQNAGASADPSSSSSDGCGCRLHPDNDASTAWIALGAAVSALALGRRRRSHRDAP